MPKDNLPGLLLPTLTFAPSNFNFQLLHASQ